MMIVTPPAFVTALVPSFQERGPGRFGCALAADLRKLAGREKKLAVYLTEDQIAAHVAVCNVLAATGGRVIVTFGKCRAQNRLHKHRAGRILLVRADLIFCPVPRDGGSDSYMPGVDYRIDYARMAVTNRARETGSEAAEWFPTGERYQLWPEK